MLLTGDDHSLWSPIDLGSNSNSSTILLWKGAASPSLSFYTDQMEKIMFFYNFLFYLTFSLLTLFSFSKVLRTNTSHNNFPVSSHVCDCHLALTSVTLSITKTEVTASGSLCLPPNFITCWSPVQKPQFQPETRGSWEIRSTLHSSVWEGA